MSLRYTGEATMDEPALRDVERWKDKIEVRLDNRQVFFLFFGSAMVACMLFVLGVIVGKRLESRGRAEAPAIEDPLAVLDRFGVAPAAPAPAALTFPHALIGGGGSKAKSNVSDRAERADRGERQDRAERAERLLAKPILTATATPTVAATATSPVPASMSPSVKATAAPSAPSARSAPKAGTVAPAISSEVVPSDVSAPKPGSDSKKLAALPRPLPSGPSKLALAGASTPADKAKSHFLLQLSSFPDRGDAEAFARRFVAQNAYVVPSEIPGKGTWYRVRVGNYGNLQEATAAKATFEREHNVIAYVAGGGPAK